MQTIKVREVMSPQLVMVRPMQSIEEAAKLMREYDCGVLPVGTPDKVLGVITDRDIAIRVVASGKDPKIASIESAMSHSCITCNTEDSLKHAAELMHKHDVSRVLVNDGARFVGIVTIADLVRNQGNRREGDKVIHALLGRQHHAKKSCVAMGNAGAGSEGCDTYDQAI